LRVFRKGGHHGPRLDRHSFECLVRIVPQPEVTPLRL
jgi:hypothetical protein